MDNFDLHDPCDREMGATIILHLRNTQQAGWREFTLEDHDGSRIAFAECRNAS